MLPAFDWNGGPLQLESLAGIVGIRRKASKFITHWNAAERELLELDRADGDAIEGVVSQGRGRTVPASASVFQEPRAFGVIPRHAAALLSLRPSSFATRAGTRTIFTNSYVHMT